MIFISERRETLLYVKFANFGLNYRNGDNFRVAVASSSKRERPSVKTAYIRLILRIDVFEEFAIDYNLTAHILDMVRDI